MALACPRCLDVKLEEIDVGDVILDRCPRCGGIWFDNAEIGEIVGTKSASSGFESTIPPAPDGSDAMECPRCNGVDLRKLTICKDEGRACYVYRCISCIGTWLDRGELRAEEDGQLQGVLKSYFEKIL